MAWASIFFHTLCDQVVKALATMPWCSGLSSFEPHWRHWVVVLEQNTFILGYYWFNPGIKTRPCLTERLLMGRKESNQTNQACQTVYYKDHQTRCDGPYLRIEMQIF